MDKTNEAKSNQLSNLEANREAYAKKAFALIEREITPDEPRLDNPQIGFGMLRQGRAGMALSETWDPEASATGTTEITVRLDVDGKKLLLVLLHQKICTLIPRDTEKRGEVIKDKAAEYGMKFFRKQPKADKGLQKKLDKMEAELGPFPGAPIDVKYRPMDDTPKQGTRQRKVQCPACKGPLRATISTVTRGFPFCVRHWKYFELEDPLPNDPHPGPYPLVPPGWKIDPPDIELPIESQKVDPVPSEVPDAQDPTFDMHDHPTTPAAEAHVTPAEAQLDLLGASKASVGDTSENPPVSSDHVIWRAEFAFGTHVPEAVKVVIRSCGGTFDTRRAQWHGSCSDEVAAKIEELVVGAKGSFTKIATAKSAEEAQPKAAE